MASSASFRSTIRRSLLAPVSPLRAVNNGSARSSTRGIHMTPPRAALYAKADAQVFKQVTEAKGRVVLVDFYADWCGPCRQLSPLIETLTQEPKQSGTGLPLDLVKVDADSDDGVLLAQQFKVTGLPTVIAFRDGAPVNKFVGALPEARVKEFIGSL